MTTQTVAPAVQPSTLLTERILWLVAVERQAQDAKWGEQNHPLGTGAAPFKALADTYRDACDAAAERGEVTWAHIALEEVFEALAETDPNAFVTEALQAAAVLVAAIESEVRNNPALILPPPF
ncbi:MAG TPA: hypothetical protein VGF17_09630 [Phytomonospora sp.]